MSTAPSPGSGFAYYEPVTGGIAVKKYTAPPDWLEPSHTTLACAGCGWDLRPGAIGDRARFNIPDPSTPNRLRLFCGPCCNDGIGEMERLTGRQGTVSGTGRVKGQRLSEHERAAQRRIGAVIRSCGVLSEEGLALWRENGCAEFKASADELADDMAILGVPHTIVPTTLPPLVSDRSRRVRYGEEVRVATRDLSVLVAWIPSLQRPIDQLTVLAAENS